MPQPTFSVILPTFNRPEGPLNCIGGLAAQRYPRDAYEVIIVNDGAAFPDEAAVRAASDGIRVTILAQEHRGPAVARNAGAARATGRFLAFTDDDCVPDRDWLPALARQFEQDPHALVGGRTVNALQEAYADATQLVVDFLTAYYDASGTDRTRFFATSNLALPSEGFHALGGFDPRFSHAAGEDRDFCDRWHMSGRRSAFVPAAIVHHHHSLTLWHYLAQHFRYGRGAQQFHRAKRARENRRKRTPLRFYRDLVLYPLRRRSPVAGALRSVLLMTAQAASAAGYYWEGAVSSRDGHSATRREATGGQQGQLDG